MSILCYGLDYRLQFLEIESSSSLSYVTNEVIKITANDLFVPFPVVGTVSLLNTFSLIRIYEDKFALSENYIVIVTVIDSECH